MTDDSFDLAGKMEPGAKAFGDRFSLDPEICAHLSIAISVKRIADALESDAPAAFLTHLQGVLSDASHDHAQRMK